MMKKSVISFVKYPEPGEVKTRLGKKIGFPEAAMLYRHCLADLIPMLSSLDIDIRYYIGQAERVRQFRDEWRLPKACFRQSGEMLGDRMINAFRETFEQGFDSAVLIGSDSPQLSPPLLNVAFDTLLKADVVIGPSIDGGYYLFGCRRSSFRPEFFQGIEWSSPRVYESTMSAIKISNQTVVELPHMQDIDNFEDFDRFLTTYRRTPVQQSRTYEWIENFMCEYQVKKGA
jgi:rSAM/selenodomain-associated transferase 1